MSVFSKLFKFFFNGAQFSFGILGGGIYLLIWLLSLVIKPLKKLTKVYKEGAPIYSTLLMTLISTSLLLSIFFITEQFRSDITFEESTIGFLLMLIFLSPWVFLSLDLFAYYRRYRSDRKK